MSIKRIETEAELIAVEAEIERLWGSPQGTPDFDRAYDLITMVDAYNREHFSTEKAKENER